MEEPPVPGAPPPRKAIKMKLSTGGSQVVRSVGGSASERHCLLVQCGRLIHKVQNFSNSLAYSTIVIDPLPL